MTINTITPEQHKTLLEIHANHPALTLQNIGYHCIDKDKLTDEDKAKFDEVATILKAAIVGFNEFNNFKVNKQNKIQLRFQYNWSADEPSTIPFTGVGYILLDELLNGFNKD